MQQCQCGCGCGPFVGQLEADRAAGEHDESRFGAAEAWCSPDDQPHDGVEALCSGVVDSQSQRGEDAFTVSMDPLAALTNAGSRGLAGCGAWPPGHRRGPRGQSAGRCRGTIRGRA